MKDAQSIITFNIILIGDTRVGKTSYFRRFCEGIYYEKSLLTIGIEKQIKSIRLNNGETIKIVLWDTLGQEKYFSITKNFLKNADAILVLYDITNAKTFDILEKWINKIEDTANFESRIAIIGTKIDLESQRQILTETAQDYASKKNCFFFEISSKNDINVQESLIQMVELLYYDYIQRQIANEKNIDDVKSIKLSSKQKNISKSGCCR